MIAVLAGLAFSQTTAAKPAHLVIENARIWSDGRVSFADFAAVRDGRFVHVGARDSSLIGTRTVRVDVRGAVVVPGLVDSHIHMLNGGRSLSQLSLREATGKEDFVRRVREYAATLPPDAWVVGRGWSAESWPGAETPHRDWIDEATGGRPAWLVRMDGHSGLANSAALQLAGITESEPADPAGGVIDRDPATGRPTGMLRETAMGLVSSKVPGRTPEQKLADLERAMRHALAHGITAVSDIPSLGDLPVYEKLAARPGLGMRFSLYPTAADWTAAVRQAQAFRGRPGWVKVAGFKSYMDGSLGSHTAYMREPFAMDLPGKENWRGVPMPGALDGTYAKNFRAASQAGYQAIVHAIGDEGNHLLLRLLSENFGILRRARCRSEHAQHLLPEDIPRFASLGVIASMQPFHKADDGRYAESHIGTQRCQSSYAFKSLLDSGAVLAFGSDWPVVTLNVFQGIEAASTGRILGGSVWQPQENLTVAEALRCYTTAGAFAMFRESDLGQIAPGFRADFVVLDRSPFQRARLGEVKPSAVYVEGRKVYP